MPSQYEQSGTSFEEQAPASRNISGVPSSITAFIGRAPRGPIDEPISVTSAVEYDGVFGGLWTESALGHSVHDFFRQGGTTAIIVRVHQGVADDTASILIGSGTGRLSLEAASPGSWGAQLSVVVDDRVTNPADFTTFNLMVVDGGTRRVEQFPNVSLSPNSSRRLDAVLELQSSLVRLPGVLPSTAMDALPQKGIATGGNDGGSVSAANYTTGPNLRSGQRGVYALEKVGRVHMIVVPPYTPSGDVDEQVITDTIEYAATRGAMMIMDPPSAWTRAASAVEGVSTTGFPVSSHAALYFPRIRQPDPARDNRVATFAPSGAVAGVIARTVATHGVWKAPEGMAANLDGVTDLSVRLSDDEINELSQLGVNCLNAIPGGGHFIWGARTREGADQLGSQWKYLPVQRTALYIESSLQGGLQWVAFEPNDETTWSEIRLAVGDFLNQLFRQGAFAGETAVESYFVKCDSTTTNGEDIESQIVNIVVGFAPLKPAEFVVLELQQATGEARRSRLRRRPRKRARRKDRSG